jgi:hypothetical protein
MNLNPIPPLGSWKNRSMQMIPPTPSPTLALDVQRQANEYHQAAAVERRRANHHQADLNLVAAAELPARPPEDQPELPDGTQEARRPTPNRVPSDRPAASTGLGQSHAPSPRQTP